MSTSAGSGRVVIGMDPHKRSATIELIPGGAKKNLSSRQAKTLFAKVRPRDAVGKTRRRVAAELINDLERVYARKKAANAELTELLAATGASLTGLPGIGPSDQVRHRLSRAGNRQINRVLHIMARVQIRSGHEGRGYYERKKADGKAPMEAMRCVKRRLSDLVYRTMLDDTLGARTGPGGRRGNDSDSSATGSQPHDRLFGQATPGPATNQPKPPLPKVS